MKILLILCSTLFARPVFYKIHRAMLFLSLRGLGVFNFETDYISGEKHFLKSIISSIDENGGIVVDIGGNMVLINNVSK